MTPIRRMTVTTRRSQSWATMDARIRIGQDGHKYKVEARLKHNDSNEEAGPGHGDQEEKVGKCHNEHQEETGPRAMTSTRQRQEPGPGVAMMATRIRPGQAMSP